MRKSYVINGKIEVKKYWEIHYNKDFDHTAKYFEEKIAELLTESVNLHLRSDVPVGSYVSGGLDSSIVASLASEKYSDKFMGFTMICRNN